MLLKGALIHVGTRYWLNSAQASPIGTASSMAPSAAAMDAQTIGNMPNWPCSGYQPSLRRKSSKLMPSRPVITGQAS